MGCVSSVVKSLVELTIRPGDSPDEVAFKRAALPLYFVCGLLFVFLNCVWCIADGSCYQVLGDFAVLTIWLTVLIVGVIGSYITRFSQKSLMRATLVVCAVALVAADLSSAARVDPRLWPLVVVVLDASLIFNVEPGLQRSVVASFIIWFIVERVEAVYGFGLYSLAFLDGGRSDLPRAAVCDCYLPPCSIHPLAAVGHWMLMVFLFLGDFWVTRGFAFRMREQMDIVKATIKVAEQVTRLLSRYEVSRAVDVIQSSEGGCLPAELRASLLILTQNLETYRAYLPQTCLPDGSVDVLEETAETEPLARTAPSRRASVDTTATMTRSVRSARRPSDARSLGPGFLQVPAALGAVMTHPQSKVVTLLVVNGRGFLRRVAETPSQEVGEMLAEGIERALETVAPTKGTTDLVHADHIFASFNGARPCPSHRVVALRCGASVACLRSWTSGQPQTTSAVCSGTAICGDFGCDTFKRYMTVGSLSSAAMATDRLAARWNCCVLVDGSVRSEALTSWNLRWRAAVIFQKSSRRHHTLWDATDERLQGHAGQEWMYALGQAPERWQEHNHVAQLYVSGNTVEALAKAEEALAAARDRDLTEALRSLVERINTQPAVQTVEECTLCTTTLSPGLHSSVPSRQVSYSSLSDHPATKLLVEDE